MKLDPLKLNAENFEFFPKDFQVISRDGGIFLNEVNKVI